MDRKSWRLSAFFVACRRHSPASLQFPPSNQWHLGCTWGFLAKIDGAAGVGLGVCAWVLARERVLSPGGWRSKDAL